jgi:signal transduction histidine kinase
MDSESHHSGPAPSARLKLLIVDDEEGPRHSLWAIFQEDYETFLAENGAEALEILSKNQIDAAVLDIRMPDMSGTELLARIKEKDKSIEVIMLTAFQTVETAREALRFGACDYLTKPFDIGSMCAAVANAMDRRLLSQQIESNTGLLSQLQKQINQERLHRELERTQRDIYASVLHDINNPLAIVNGLIELIQAKVSETETLQGADLHAMRNQLATTNRQLCRCVEISRRYLGFLKPKGSGPEVCLLNPILDDVEELLRAHPCRGQNQLKIDRLPNNVALSMNGLDLLQILVNLGTNALQSTDRPHLVTITPKVLSEPVPAAFVQDSAGVKVVKSQKFNPSQSMAQITVYDDGPGIPEELLGRICDPFFTTKSGSQGTGLGLSIVHRLISASEGFMRIENRGPDGGISFSIFLPISSQA